jgi:protein TonB
MMTMEGGFHQPRKLSPTAIAVVVLLHGAALTALVTAKMDMPPKRIFTPIDYYPVPIPPPPPPHPVRQPPKEHSRDTVTTDPSPFPIKDAPPTYFPPPPPPGPPPSTGTGSTGPTLPPPPPKVDPVRTGPSIDPRSILQPPYPAALEREGVEGQVTVRVLIGADGRVRSVEKMSATSDDFFLATERHALRNWRFRPATIDGRPVESSKIMLLRFQLNG